MRSTIAYGVRLPGGGDYAYFRPLYQAERDDQCLLMDSTAVRVHAHGASPTDTLLAPVMGRSNASVSSKIHIACDALGYPLGFMLSGANVLDFDLRPPPLPVCGRRPD